MAPDAASMVILTTTTTTTTTTTMRPKTEDARTLIPQRYNQKEMNSGVTLGQTPERITELPDPTVTGTI